MNQDNKKGSSQTITVWNQSQFKCLVDGFTAGPRIQFATNGCDMKCRRVFRDAQVFGDAFVGLTLAEQQNLRVTGATLARALRQAVRWKLMVYNPAEAVDQIRVPKREMQVWEPEEVTAFLERAREDRLYALFFLALTTGMRMGELLALNWRDISLNGSRPIITVRTSVTREGGKPMIGEPKTAAGTRWIALSSDQVDVLTAHQVAQDLKRTCTGHWQDQGLVFPSTEGTLFNSSNFNTRHWLVLREVSGVKIIRFHDLRYTYASLAIRTGMDVRLLADRLGHRDPVFMRTYAHVFGHHRHGGAFSLDTLLAEPDRSLKG
jgi:integrase